jgi:hypothetical protein
MNFRILGRRRKQLHLLFARLRRRFLGAAQLLEQLHRPCRGLHHVQIAHAGQLDDFLGRDDPDHRIAVGAARLQIGQDGRDMFLDEQEVRDDDIAMAHGDARLFQGCGVFGPFGGGMNADVQPRKLPHEPFADTRRRTSRMAVQRDNHDPVAGNMIAVTAHNGPWPHTRCRC